MRTLIIAEAGINHNGSIKRAFKLIDAAKYSGADIVKFQIAIPEEVMIPNASKANYQKRNNQDKETQLQMVSRILININYFSRIKNYCIKKKN